MLARRGRAVAVESPGRHPAAHPGSNGQQCRPLANGRRICLRVRERHNVDLILGQGSAGSRVARARAHPARRRSRSPRRPGAHHARTGTQLLITDDQISLAASSRAGRRRPTRPRHQERPLPPAVRPSRPTTRPRPPPGSGWGGRERAVDGAVRRATEGAPVWVLMGACGMGRSWVYAPAGAGAGQRRPRGAGKARLLARGRHDGRPRFVTRAVRPRLARARARRATPASVDAGGTATRRHRKGSGRRATAARPR